MVADREHEVGKHFRDPLVDGSETFLAGTLVVAMKIRGIPEH